MLQTMRLKQGLSQSQLAIKTGIPKNTIISYEHGVSNINTAKLETLLKFCIVLECKLNDLLTDTSLMNLVTLYDAR